MGGRADSERQDYQDTFLVNYPPANRTTSNHLPRLFSGGPQPHHIPKMIWKFLHKPRYVDVGQLDGKGRTAAQVATDHGKDDVAALLQVMQFKESQVLGDGAEDG